MELLTTTMPIPNPSTFTLTTIPQSPSHPPFYPNQSRPWWIRQATTASTPTRKSNSTVEVGFFIPMFSLITTTLCHPSAHWFMSHRMWHQSCLSRSHNLDKGCWIKAAYQDRITLIKDVGSNVKDHTGNPLPRLLIMYKYSTETSRKPSSNQEQSRKQKSSAIQQKWKSTARAMEIVIPSASACCPYPRSWKHHQIQQLQMCDGPAASCKKYKFTNSTSPTTMSKLRTNCYSQTWKFS